MQLAAAWFVAIVTLAGTHGAAAEKELATAMTALSTPTMAGNAHDVEAFEFSYGNAGFTMDGEVEGVLGAESPVGFALQNHTTVKIHI